MVKNSDLSAGKSCSENVGQDKTPCAECERPDAIRHYRYQTEVHSRLCKKCSRSNKRVERIEFTCSGYRDHGVIRHAKNCPRTKLLAPHQIKNRESRKKRKPHLVFDATLRMYQSPGCASAGRLLALTEKRLKKFHPGKIRSRKKRSELLSENHLHITPKTFGPNVEKIRSRRRHDAPGVTIAHFIRWWSRSPDKLPTDVRMGLCIHCGKLAITPKRVPTVHFLPHGNSCRRFWLRTPEGRNFNSLRRRGLKPNMPQSELERRVRVPIKGLSGTEDSLKISFSWAVQHYLHVKSKEKGKSYRTIAKENGVNEKAVRVRIAGLIKLLPKPELLQRRWQRAVGLILDAQRKEAALHF